MLKGAEGAIFRRLRSTGDEQQSGDLDPHHRRTPGAPGGARPRGGAHAGAARRPRATSPTWTACSPTACPCCATTTRRPPPWATSSPSPSGARGPDTAGDRRAWLYALARWACLRKLAEAKQKRQGTPRGGPSGGLGSRRRSPPRPPVPEETQEQRRRELALLAWPEAAGTTPEQREALELAVRHQLAAHEVAAVLGMDLAAARDLLASAACEVERTRAALAVVETGGCPSVARLTGDNQLVLSAALRRELVRHVDDCPRCRRTAERAVPGRWPGAASPPPNCPSWRRPARPCTWRWRTSRARGAPRTALRPARLPDGPQGPRGPPGPPPRACRHDDRRRHRGRRPGARPLGRLPGRPDRRGPGRPLRQRQRGARPRQPRRRGRGDRRLRERRQRQHPPRQPLHQGRQARRLRGGHQRRRRRRKGRRAPGGRPPATAATPPWSPSPRPAPHRSAGPRPPEPAGSTSASRRERSHRANR